MGVRTDRRQPAPVPAATIRRGAASSARPVRRPALVTAVIAATVGLAACGGGGASASKHHSSSSSTSTSTGGGATAGGGAPSGRRPGSAPRIVQASVSPSAVLHCLPSKTGVVAVTVSWSSANDDYVDIDTPDGGTDAHLPKSGSKSYTIPCDGTAKTFELHPIVVGFATAGFKDVTVTEALIKSNSGTVPTLPKTLPTSTT